MMQAAQPWYRYDPAIYAGILPCFTTGRRSLRERQMRSIVVVQVGDKTPIKTVIAKCITVGTPGTNNRFMFKSKPDAEAVWYCAACEAN